MGTPDKPATAARPDDARVAGRGFLLITLAKIYFVLTSTVVNIGLPRLLKDPAAFGDYRVVSALISIINMVMITGTIQAVSKLVSENEALAGGVKWKAVRVQALIGGPLFLAVFAFADPIATYVLNDPDLGGYIRVASSVVLFYSFYAIFVGLFNGLKRFKGQAGLDITFSTLKTALIVGLVLSGFGVLGSFVGFAAAAAIVLVISVVATRRIRGGRAADVPTGRMARFMLEVMGYTLLVNVLLQLDVILVKALKYEPFASWFTGSAGRLQLGFALDALGLRLDALSDASQPVAAFAAHATSTLSGYYGAVKNVATVPYQAIISITFVIFPLLSQATYTDDIERSRTHIRQTFRWSLILVSAAVVAIGTSARPLTAILFGQGYTIGSLTLVLQLAAAVFFSLFFVANTLITASGKPRTALFVGAFTVALNAVALVTMLALSGPWQEAMEAAAVATLVAMALGFGAAAWLIRRRFGALMSPATALRVLVAAALAIGAGLVLPGSSLAAVLVRAVLAGVVFLGALFVLREFRAADLANVKRIIGRKAAPPPAP